jgi:hypothetical protein
MEWQRHHTIAALIAIIVAVAFVLFMAPSLGWL